MQASTGSGSAGSGDYSGRCYRPVSAWGGQVARPGASTGSGESCGVLTNLQRTRLGYHRMHWGKRVVCLIGSLGSHCPEGRRAGRGCEGGRVERALGASSLGCPRSLPGKPDELSGADRPVRSPPDERHDFGATVGQERLHHESREDRHTAPQQQCEAVGQV